ncbi:unnamed protein product [Eretmochelys imbricata]
MGLELYLDLLSQPCRTVYIFAKKNNIPFEFKHVELFKDSILGRKMPGGNNPGHSYEGPAILAYLSQKYKTPDHWYPLDMKKRAWVDEYLAWQHSAIWPSVLKIFWLKVVFPLYMDQTAPEEKLQETLEYLAIPLKQLEQKFLQDKPFLVGNKIFLADLVAVTELMQVTMQSSSSQETMQSQNCQRAPAWTKREVRALIAVWGDESVLAEFRSKRQNAKIFEKISNCMKDRGYNRDPQQCRVKIKELRQAYQKNREANGRSSSEPQTCHLYDELHAILGGAATTTPTLCFDSVPGVGGNTEVGFGGEEDDGEEEVVDSSQQGSGETGFPNSQDLFITLDLDPVPPEPTQGRLPDPEGGEGTSGECTFVNIIHGLKASVFND